MVTWSLRAEQVRAAKKLRWIHSPAAAVHQLMIPEIVNSDILVTNASSVHGPVVAEHVMALMFALAKRIPAAVRYQQQHVWCKNQLWDEWPRPREVAGATLGVIGVGSIGGEVARRAIALGMNVIAMREHPERGADFLADGREEVRVVGTNDLGILLSHSDFVVVAAPLRESTRALINSESIRCMRKAGYLINVARGALVEEGALAQALREGRIAAAASDVFDQEPLPADSPLWDVPNLLITPHSAAITERLWDRHYGLISENLRRYLRGEELAGLVDKRKGY
jgi:phosphoglycerate dehydrogenase-like enzyme